MFWFSTKTQPPTEDGIYLMSGIKQNGKRYVSISSYRVVNNVWRCCGVHVKKDRISHWMDLPKLPVLTEEEDLELTRAADRDAM